MEKEKLYQLKSDASKISPILNIGKNGVTETLIEELNNKLKVNRLVKVRVLKSAEEGKDLKTIAAEITAATRSTLIDVRGRTVVLYR
ncbi:YhbY family RNA-binding protein [Methanosarcina sp. 2.H.A.1B.4]|uniref:YhbY family RNA-binding protein n=1 Tax=Methanosarcina sp. 2.H.A.1B.4 TaxID=1483600 RepID=UPI000620F13C|nr:YhbY family RNA-binding protein [Methanosarcina sp. 2.H.A.1B.4]KKG11467.1 RNA-binding protein [Methanosarcina sp. 2.H.A.1B.4]